MISAQLGFTTDEYRHTGPTTILATCRPQYLFKPEKMVVKEGVRVAQFLVGPLVFDGTTPVHELPTFQPFETIGLLLDVSGVDLAQGNWLVHMLGYGRHAKRTEIRRHSTKETVGNLPTRFGGPMTDEKKRAVRDLFDKSVSPLETESETVDEFVNNHLDMMKRRLERFREVALTSGLPKTADMTTWSKLFTLEWEAAAGDVLSFAQMAELAQDR